MQYVYVLATYLGPSKNDLKRHHFRFKGYLKGEKIGQLLVLYNGELILKEEYFFLLEISEIKCNILFGSIKNLKPINLN